jgi:hypothetical protein
MSNKSITDVIVARKASRASRYDGGGLFDYFKSKPLPQPTFDEKDKYKLSNRIQNYRFIKSYLDHIKPNDCLTEKQFGDKMGYTIRDIVDLVEQFGTPSQTTAIYRTLLKKDRRDFWIASKAMNGDINENNNQNETELMKRNTEELIITELSKHFVIMYKSTFCEDSKVEKSRRLVNFNELCDGDIRSLLSDDTKSYKDTLYNILFQCVISLATFHNMIGYTHNDTHNGNFLYQTNNEEIKGYYHYTLGYTSFYLKHCPYNICLYDFGHSKELRPENTPYIVSYNSTSIFNDYHLLIHNFNEKDDSMDSIMEQINKYFRTNKTNPQFKTLFFEEILRLMKKHSPEGMILDVLPDGAVPLNEKPFIISNHKAIGGSLGGSLGIVVKYKSTGEHVHIVYNNKKLKRCVYAKAKGRGKYCKINKIYILLSKLKLADE